MTKNVAEKYEKDEDFIYLVEIFEETFDQIVDKRKIVGLVEYFGYEALKKTFSYFLIFPPKLKEGKNNNPYGLIFVVTKTPEKFLK